MWFLIVLGIIVIILKFVEEYYNYNFNNKKDYINDFKGKLNEKILTDTEFNFYVKVKEITDKYNLLLFPKIRLADIIKTNNYSDFNKIKSKHIDFTICKKDTKPILFIELDDYSHTKKMNKQNDNKKDAIMQSLFIKILRVKTNEIEKNLTYIENIIKSKTSSK